MNADLNYFSKWRLLSPVTYCSVYKLLTVTVTLWTVNLDSLKCFTTLQGVNGSYQLCIFLINAFID